ncbi:hypothetical protein [Paenibacillus sp. HW567]|uniref:hypothetical protein n=1 Tax=Paenibacillus sp. HW567 TaxID=1034769 RepID=UPI0003739166|nr:hypothetical protein [Paenibacillus sp. HW567]
MIQLTEFFLFYYYKNNRYILPIALYGLSIYFVYGAGNIPLADGYSLTSVFLFIFSVWTGYSFIELEEITLQKLTVLHYKGKVKRYYIAKVAAAWLVSLIIILFNLSIPFLGTSIFDLKTLVSAFVAQNSIALLGIVTAMFFNIKVVKDKSIALIGTFIVIVISLAFKSIYDRLPSKLGWVLFGFPPISFSLDLINKFNFTNLLVPYIYFIITLICCLKIIEKNSF